MTNSPVEGVLSEGPGCRLRDPPGDALRDPKTSQKLSGLLPLFLLPLQASLSGRVQFGFRLLSLSPYTMIANPFPPYSLQKRPKPQICSKFVPAIVLGGSSQGD